MTRHVVVVGGGIAGLAAALRLRDRCADSVEITLVEGSDRLGGKIRTGSIDARVVETGAEAFLARAADDPTGAPSAATELAHRVGLGDALIHPGATSAVLLGAGGAGPVPGGTLMGVPADVSTMDDAFRSADARDADLGHPVLGPDEDAAVGALVRSRLGDAIVDRLVDPLLGGVYAGRADDLSVAVTMPGLAAACRIENTLQAAVRRALGRRATTPGPVFATVQGGLSRLVEAILAAQPSSTVRTGRPVRSLAPAGEGTGWRLVLGSTRDPYLIDADAVVLAVPSHPAARLLESVLPDVAREVAVLDYASIGLVTFALPAGALDGTALEHRSGALVPAIGNAASGGCVKAVTVFSTKWAAQRDGAVLLRASVGRYGDEHVLAYDDATLISLVHADLGSLLDTSLTSPLAATVTRWGGALPQYAPGHRARTERARAALPPTIALAGAAFDGVGIPICIRSGQTAADRVIDALELRS